MLSPYWATIFTSGRSRTGHRLGAVHRIPVNQHDLVRSQMNRSEGGRQGAGLIWPGRPPNAGICSKNRADHAVSGGGPEAFISSATGIAVGSAMTKDSISPINGDFAPLPGPARRYRAQRRYGPSAPWSINGRRHPQAPRSQPPSCPLSAQPAAQPGHPAVRTTDRPVCGGGQRGLKSSPPCPAYGPGTTDQATGHPDWSGVSIDT